MLFEFNLYSAILLLFFCVGLCFAILLLFKANIKKVKADNWLALFLLLCILYITPWMLGFAGWYDTPKYREIIFYVTFHHIYFIGPVMYFYVQSLLNPAFSVSKKNWWHLLPGMLYLIYAIFTWAADNYIFAKPYFYADGADLEFDSWYQISGFFSMLFYFIISLRYYNLYKKMIVQNISYADWVLFKWVKTFLIAFLVMLIIKALFQIADLIPAFQKLSYRGAWGQYFLFGITFCYVGIMGYSNEVNTKLPFETNVLDNSIVVQGEIEEQKTMVAFDGIDASILEWKPKLENYLYNQKAYQNEELNLSQMARDLKTNPNIISKTINQGFGVNFNDWVNQARVKAVQQKLQKGQQQTQTLLSIAFDCGFNSKATFNRAFKKYTNLSPKEWMDDNLP